MIDCAFRAWLRASKIHSTRSAAHYKNIQFHSALLLVCVALALGVYVPSAFASEGASADGFEAGDAPAIVVPNAENDLVDSELSDDAITLQPGIVQGAVELEASETPDIEEAKTGPSGKADPIAAPDEESVAIEGEASVSVEQPAAVAEDTAPAKMEAKAVAAKSAILNDDDNESALESARMEEAASHSYVAILNSGTLHIMAIQRDHFDLLDLYWLYSTSNTDNTVKAASTRGLLQVKAAPVLQVPKVYYLGDGVISEGQNAPWYEARDGIYHVTFGEGVTPTNMSNWFSGLSQLQDIDFRGLDTSRVGDMSDLFGDCGSLGQLDVTSFDTGNVTNMARMFSGCAKIVSLDLSSFNTRNVVDMSGMFSGCSSITSLDLSTFNTESLKSASDMFAGCESLVALDVSGFPANLLASAAIPLGILPDTTPSAGGQGGSAPIAAPVIVPGNPASAISSIVTAALNPSNGSGAAASQSSGGIVSAAAGGVTGMVFEGALAGEPGSPATESIPDHLTPLVDNVGQSMFGPNLDNALELDQVAQTASDILEFLGFGDIVDKTMAMVIAAMGMMIAAGLILALCLKIR